MDMISLQRFTRMLIKHSTSTLLAWRTQRPWNVKKKPVILLQPLQSKLITVPISPPTTESTVAARSAAAASGNTITVTAATAFDFKPVLLSATINSVSAMISVMGH